MTHISHQQPRAHLDTELLSAYLDNQVTSAERAKIEAHLQACAACQAELNGLRQTVILVRALPRVPVPHAFTLSEAQVGRRQPTARRAWLSGLLQGLAAATAVALIAIVAGSLLRWPTWTLRQYLTWQGETTAPTIVPAPMLAIPREEPATLAEAAPTMSEKEGVAVVASADATSVPVEKTLPTVPALVVAAPTATEAPAEVPAVARAVAAEASLPPTAERRPVTVPLAPSPAAEVRAAAEEPVPVGSPPDLSTSLEVHLPESTPSSAPLAAILPQGVGLAYTDQQGLWVVDRETGIRQVVQGSGLTTPLISHDRSWIAYRVLQQETWEVWAVRWDGSGTHLVLSERDLPSDNLEPDFGKRHLHTLQWIPGRLTLAVTTIAFSPQGAPRFELWHQKMIPGSLAYVRQMEPTETAFYSPDGAYLAVLGLSGKGQEGRLMLFDGDGSNGRVLLHFPVTASASELQAWVQWLPDASALLVAVVGSAHEKAGVDLYRISVDAQATTLGYIQATALAWSPNGERLAYLRPIEGMSDGAELIVARADGSQAQPYAVLQGGTFIAWSPDALYFLYQSEGQVYLGAVGQPPQRVGDQAAIFDPCWIGPAQFIYRHAIQGGPNGTAGAAWELILQNVSGQAYTLAVLPHNISLDLISTE